MSFPSLVARAQRRPVIGLLVALLAGMTPLVASLAAPAKAADAPTGYWLVATDGGIFSYGDAGFFGSTGAMKLNRPITGMAPTPSGRGYWLVATDGGIFSYGDAVFYGSTGSMKLNRPIVGMAPTPSGRGYWLVATDGGIFSYGDAGFFGAAPQEVLRPGTSRQVVAMVPTRTGQGYWQVSKTGELFAFGDAPDLGAPVSLNRALVGMAAVPGTGLASAEPPATSPPPPAATPPPAGAPQRFGSTANVTWGSATDMLREDSTKAGTFPYAQLVEAIAEVGSKAFVGGEFTNLADPNGVPATPAQPYLSVLDVGTGAPLPGSTFSAAARPDGPVHAVVASADGRRLYVGGEFNTIGGRAIKKIAALNTETGEWDPAFNPPTPNAYVRALALSPGGRLFIGGSFTSLQTPSGVVERPEVAALDEQTGALIEDFLPPANNGGAFSGQTGQPTEDPPGTYNPGNVRAMALTKDGATLMVGGNFLHFGNTETGHQHAGLIALDAMTGRLTPWQPIEDRPVYGLTISPADGATVYTAAGGSGGVLQAYLPHGKPTKPLWTGHVDGNGMSVAATSERVYLVGHFDHQVPNSNDPCLRHTVNGGISCPNGTPHRHLAAFDLKGNVDPSFTAQANTPEGPYVAYIGAHHMYVGGNFAKVSDTPQANYRSQLGLAVYPAIG
ncbi:MAG: WD40 repeat domain-containing protein [Acidimicrobiia bacterium]